MIQGPQFDRPLFHGSGQDISKVRPSQEHGVSTFGDAGKGTTQVAKEHAFATTSEHDAWYFAGRAHGAYHQRDETGAPVRPRVYTVAPHPDMQMGLRNSERPGGPRPSRFGLNNPDKGEYTAPHFNVTGRIDIKPGHQGTFPQINWNQFPKGNFNGPYVSDDLNHPSKEDEEFGRPTSSMRRQYNEVTNAHAAALNESAPVDPRQGKLF